MKKIKFLGAAVLAASLIFAGCANGSDDEDYSAPETPAVENPTDSGDGTDQNNNNNNSGNNGSNQNNDNNSGNDNSGNNGGNTGNNNSGNNGGNTGNNNSGNNDGNNSGNNGGNETGDTEDDEDIGTNYNAPDLSTYYKKYLVSSPKQASNVAVADWGSGSVNTDNTDGTWNLTSAHLWDPNASEGVCAALTGFDEGTFANYEYIVFTVDTTNFVIEKGDGNKGVNVKVAKSNTKIGDQKSVISNCVSNENVKTYYAPISLFENNVLAVGNEAAIIIGGYGTLKLNEVYLAATEDPATKAITGITISPTSASLQKNGTKQFTVIDSNYVNRTSEVTYTLSGDLKDDCSITTDGLLTVGTTAGELTVTASYTVNDKTFTSSATITVIGEMTNLITDIQFKKMYLANSNWQPYVNNVENENDIPADVNFSISEDGTISFTTLVDTNAVYNTQLFLTTDADLHEGDEWLFSCKIGGVDGTWTIKLNDAEALIPLQTGSFTTAGSEVSFCSPAAVTSANASENIVLFFSFSPSPAGTITISDIVLTKTN